MGDKYVPCKANAMYMYYINLFPIQYYMKYRKKR